MNQQQSKNKVSYLDFMKSLKSSKGSTSAVTPKLTKDLKQNNKPSNVVKAVSKIIKQNEQLKQALTSRPKSFGRQSKTMHSSTINHGDGSYTTRIQTQFDSIHTQRNSCSKSKSKGHCDSENTFYRDSGCRKSSDAKIMLYYLNQILLVLEELPRLNIVKITYLDYLQLLRLLNMIQPNYEPSKTDHVHKFWSIISSKDSTINLVNFIIVFLASLNISSTSTGIINIVQASTSYQFHSIKFMKSKPTLYRIDKLGYISLTKQQVKQIHNQFKQFRTTRMFLGRIQKKGEIIEQKLQQYSNHKFHPVISNKSILLAKIRKQKNIHKTSMNQQSVVDQDIRDLDENLKQVLSPRNNLGIRRSQMLYKLCKSKSKERRDRSQDEVLFERNEKVYTFKPELKKRIKVKKPQVDKKLSNVSGEQKTLERFLKGRVQKQVKRKSLQIGNTYNNRSVQKLRKRIADQLIQKTLVRQSQQIQRTPTRQNTNQPEHASPLKFIPQIISQRQPVNIKRKQISHFQVYLQGGVFVDVIRVYEGDCIQQIATQFIQKHKLKPEMLTKLINSINMNIQSIQAEQQKLQEIQQESMECSFDFSR